ncbi:MAG: hypothetical protein ACREJS_09630 [Candidatus Rokuibacteriota bacterium]
MSIEWVSMTVTALLPFAAVGGLLWLARVIGERRDARVARQIALTDAIHRELGAAAAPQVQRSWTRGWIVSVRLPLHREETVGAITRITHDLFCRLDRQDPPRLRLVLIPQEVRPWDRAKMIGSPHPAARLSRAA